MTAVALLALTIAFPRAGAKLPYLERCHLIGATSGGETNLVIQGRNVPVYRTGAWSTMVDCVEGTNVVDVAGSNHWFCVMRRPPARPSAAPAAPVPERAYPKLAYAADNPKPHPSTLEPRPSPGEITVVVDAGHGGSDTGTLSPHGLPEKDANLRMAKAVRDELAKLGYHVVLTREDDRFVKLYDRPRVAHANYATAFISIHHNAPPPAKDPAELRYHAVYAWNDIGTALATAINARMAETLGTSLVNNGVPHANFAVTRNPEIPSCLVEVDFITSPPGEEACWDPARRQRLARAIAAGFADWCTGKADL